MAIPYTISENAIGVVVGFRPIVIPRSHPNYAEVERLVKLPNTTEEQIEKLMDIPKAIEEWTEGDVRAVNGQLFYKGFEVKNNLASVILKFIKEGQASASAPFRKFLEKSFRNPDPRAASDLYDWVVKSGLPITPDGDILAWKAVRADYGSIYAGDNKQYDHHPGNVVKEDRSKCDPNPDRTCSRGLHFCSAPYLRNYAGGGSRVIAVAISPANVVAFPEKYDWEKGRACEYKVVAEIDPKLAAEFYPTGRIVYDGYAEDQSLGNFKVGEIWCDRNGLRYKITELKETDDFPVVARPVNSTVVTRAYTKDGRFANDGTISPVDLVRKEC